MSKGGEQAMVEIYFAQAEHLSCLRECSSHISNLFDGVHRKFIDKMHFANFHPILSHGVLGHTHSEQMYKR